MTVRVFLVAMALLLAAPLYAENLSAETHFDKTGDGLVNVEDWRQMRDDEKRIYARDSLRELGLDPEAGIGKGKTRVDSYLEGLRSVYRP